MTQKIRADVTNITRVVLTGVAACCVSMLLASRPAQAVAVSEAPSMTITTPGGTITKREDTFITYDVTQTDQDTYKDTTGATVLLNGGNLNTVESINSMLEYDKTNNGQSTTGARVWTISGTTIATLVDVTKIDSWVGVDENNNANASNGTLNSTKDPNVTAQQQVRVTAG
jgi:hypothetical protein